MRRAIQMGTLLTSARRAVQALGPRGKTTRVPEAVRVVVLAYAREARSAGESWAGIAENVELSQTALQRWHSKGARKLVRVVVAQPPARETRLTLTTAGGERLEGLGLEDAVRIIRALR
jgi:transposase